MHKSLKYEIWASTDLGNKRLDRAFRESADKGPIYLFFSVNGSGHFAGMAQMLTPVDYAMSSNVWASDKWKGVLKVKWIYIKDVPLASLRHIRLSCVLPRELARGPRLTLLVLAGTHRRTSLSPRPETPRRCLTTRDSPCLASSRATTRARRSSRCVRLFAELSQLLTSSSRRTLRTTIRARTRPQPRTRRLRLPPRRRLTHRTTRRARLSNRNRLSNSSIRTSTSRTNTTAPHTPTSAPTCRTRRPRRRRWSDPAPGGSLATATARRTTATESQTLSTLSSLTLDTPVSPTPTDVGSAFPHLFIRSLPPCTPFTSQTDDF